VTIEEQRLSEMLHRLTPEPPRRVTVEDVAIRLANKNAPARGARMSRGQGDGGQRGGGQAGGFRPRRGRLVPLLAAAAVVLIAGASAGVAVTLSSHTSKTPPAAGGGVHSTGPAVSATSSPVQSASTLPSTTPASAGHPATSGPLLYSVVGTVGVTEATLASDGKSLYAFNTNNLVELDPSTGKVVHQAPADGFPGQAPVIAGNKVWEVTSYGGSSVALSGYNEQTLAADGTIAVPASGSASGDPASVLTAGPNGNLYLAAGRAIEEVDPSSGSVVRQFTLPGTANSVAVSPEGSRIYAGINGSSYQIAEVNATTGRVVSIVSVGQGGGDLVASAGGVWFTTGSETAEQVWFAPATNLHGVRSIAGPSVGGDEAIPTYAGGVVWVGGTKQVECLDPATGQVRATGTVPYNAVAPAGFGDVVSAGGHVYALYVNNRVEQGDAAGSLVMLNPSSACTAGGTSSGGTGS
jgi:PQQ-like domain